MMNTQCLKGPRAVSALWHHQEQDPGVHPGLDELLSQPVGPFFWHTDHFDPKPALQQFTLALRTCSTLSYTLKFMQERCDTASINQEVIILFWKVTLCGAVLCVLEVVWCVYYFMKSRCCLSHFCA